MDANREAQFAASRVTSPLYAAFCDLADAHADVARIDQAIAAQPGYRRIALTYDGVALECLFDYEPGEAAEVNDFDGGHPGRPDSYVLVEAMHKGVNVFDLLSENVIDHLEQEAAQ